MGHGLAEGGYDVAASDWSKTGATRLPGGQIILEESKTEMKLDARTDPARAIEWSFVQR
jgi:hypothetical protein